MIRMWRNGEVYQHRELKFCFCFFVQGTKLMSELMKEGMKGYLNWSFEDISSDCKSVYKDADKHACLSSDVRYKDLSVV